MEMQQGVGNVTEVKGELTYEEKVIQKIIGIALEEVDGLLSVDGGFFSNIAGKIVNTDDVTTGIDVEVGKEQVAVDLKVVVEYGKDIANLYDRIKQVITKQIKEMTKLNVVEINVDVVDIKTKKQFDDESVTVQDRVSDLTSSTGEFISDKADKAKETINKGTEEIKENNQSRVE